MRIKALVEEDFTNYKEPVLFIGTASCSGKCCIEAGIPLSVCQNDEWRRKPVYDISNDTIIEKFLANKLTVGICFGGLEPLEQTDEVIEFIDTLRNKYHIDAPVIIYTGYCAYESGDILKELQKYNNIIIKFGRYLPNHEPHYDKVLGVELASDNQYAIKIS